MRQHYQGSRSPELSGEALQSWDEYSFNFGLIGTKYICIAEFRVGTMEGVHVGMHGLGPLNWLGKKVVMRVTQQNFTQVLEVLGKDIIMQEFIKLSIVEHFGLKIFTNVLR